MEGKLNLTDLDSALSFLERLEWEEEYGYLESSIEMMRHNVRFLRMLFWGLTLWEDLEYDWHLHFAINAVMPHLSQIAKEFEPTTICIHDQDQSLAWEAVICDLEKAIRQFKPQLREICIALLGGAFRCTSCPPNLRSFSQYGRGTASFAHIILQNLMALQNSNLIAESTKQHFALIQGKLEEFRAFVVPLNFSGVEVKKLYELLSHARTWCNRVSCLAYLYWVDEGKDDSLASSMETVVSGLFHKPMPCSISGIISSYFQRTTIPQLLAGYLDFLLQYLVIHVKDDIHNIHEGLIFLLSFIMDSPDDDSEDRELVQAQIYALINEFRSLIYSIHGELKRGIIKAVFFDFLLKIDTLKAKVTSLYLINPYSSSLLNAPHTNAIRFLSSVIEHLKSMLEEDQVNLLPSSKKLCEVLVAELVSITPLLHDVMVVLQEDDGEKIQDLRREIMNMVYNAHYFIKFFPARSFSVWYGIIALPNILKNVNNVKTKIENFGANIIYKKKKLGTHLEVEETRDLPLSRSTTSKINGVFIGFKEVARDIYEELTRGQKSLKIISISGLAGQGKTTLAKKIYNDRNIQYHFHKFVWCYVSKDCPTREILLQIIGDDHKGVNVKGLEMHGLEDHLRKILKGRRYLIVMDDIWDVDAWYKLKWSFPDDNNGSRILFTTRNLDLASHAKSNSISHCLPLFSTEESWELMNKMVFHSEVCPEEFVATGRKENCKLLSRLASSSCVDCWCSWKY